MNSGLEALMPFIIAAYVMWVTPGPNNMMLTYSGLRFGVIASMPHILGILAGTWLLNTAGIVVLQPVVAEWPAFLMVVKVIGTIWLVRIGWRMASASGIGESIGQDRPMGFVAALLFQFANPKAITAALALTSLILVAAEKQPYLLPVAILLIPIISFFANSPWAFAGQGLRRFVSSPSRWRVFAVVTGGLTTLCAVFLWM